MKQIRKGLIALLATVMMLAIGIIAAGCKPSMVTLTFISNGGPAVASIEAKPGEDVTLPEGGNWADHVFEGWYTSADFSSDRLEGTIQAPNSDTTYYAKWSDGIAITLNLDGGSLAGGIGVIYAVPGSSLLNALQKYVPTKEGFTFGAWFMNDEEITSSTKTPSAAVTVTAKYKVEYTVNVYLERLDGTGYDISSKDSRTGSDYVGTTVTVSAMTITGFSYDSTNGANLTSIVLSADYKSNVLSLYYKREGYTVEYNANPPSQFTVTGAPVVTRTYTFDGHFKAEENFFTVNGCRFAGWSTSPDDTVEYQPGDDISISGRTVLYAVWDVGIFCYDYQSDVLFFPRSDEKVAIYDRGGFEYRGTRNGNDFEVTFGNKTVKGTVNNGFFTVEEEGNYIPKAGKYYGVTDTYYHYNNGVTSEKPNISQSIYLDVKDDLQATYYNGTRTNGVLAPHLYYSGSYTFTANGNVLMTVKFFEDDQKNKGFLRMGEEGSNGYMWTGPVEGEEEETQTSNGMNSIVTDGYGGITLFTISGKEIPGYYYVVKKGTVPAQSGQQDFFVLKAKIGEGEKEKEYEFLITGYYAILPDEEYSGEFISGDDGSSGNLILDGYGLTAEYDGQKGFYSTINSYRYGPIIAFSTEMGGTASKVFTIEVNGKTKTYKDATEIVDELRTVKEYCILLPVEDGRGDNGQYPEPALGDYSLWIKENNNEENNNVIIYKKSSSGNYDTEAAKGTIKKEDEIIYTFTADDDDNHGGVPKTFTFTLDENKILARGNFFVAVDWNGKPVTNGEESKSSKYEKYEGQESKISIEYVPMGDHCIGSIFTDEDGSKYPGTVLINTPGKSLFSDEKNDIKILEFIRPNFNTNSLEYIYFELKDHTIKKIEPEVPYYSIVDNGSSIDYENIRLSKRGDEGVYIDDNGDKHFGQIVEGEKTEMGSQTYTFVDDDGNEILRFSAGVYGDEQILCWFKYVDGLDAEFAIGDDETFKSDGYEYATYSTKSLTASGNIYCDQSDPDNVLIYMRGESSNSVFTYTFLFRHGTIIVINAGYTGSTPLKLLDDSRKDLGYTISFDGLSTVKIYKNDKEEYRGTYIMGTGRYIECIVDLTKAFENYGTHFIVAFLSTPDENGRITRNALIKDPSGEVRYTDNDWNVLVLNGYGSVAIYTEKGIFEGCTYEWIEKGKKLRVKAQLSADVYREYDVTIEGDVFTPDQDYSNK